MIKGDQAALSSINIAEYYQLPLKNDFVTSIRRSIGSARSFFVHESNRITISQGLCLTSAQTTMMTLQSNIYDVLGIGEVLIVSNKNMPVRVFKLPKEKEELNWGSIYDRKPNSQQFLTPLQFSILGDRIIGGGKKFASEYDLCKMTARRIKQLDKKYIASVQLLNVNLLATGQFTGTLQLLDLRSHGIVSTTKPHVDSISHIARRPLSENQFVTLARKDNYSYLWDLRNLQQFVDCFDHQRHGNQRTGLSISSDGRFLYLGGEKGQLFAHDLKEGNTSSTEMGLQKCLNSILCSDDRDLLCSIGERSFPMQGESSSPGSLFRLRHEYS